VSFLYLIVLVKSW